jgi:RNA polymerase sigma-70 factor (ECF subfamily)
MMKAILNLKKYIHKTKFSTWLIKIATNVFRDYLRKNKNLCEINDEIESISTGPEDIAVENSELHVIFEILNNISYEKRAVFILKHYYGYKYEEIAEIIDCPIGTVRSRLHNCINCIIKELEERRII